MKNRLKNKTTRNNFITYGVVILIYIVMQILHEAVQVLVDLRLRQLAVAYPFLGENVVNFGDL